MEVSPKTKEKLGIGIAVFILLALITAGEFLIGAISPVWIAPLVGAAILKAFFIVRDYMHLPRLFAADEEEH
jgi:hypothetical protein